VLHISKISIMQLGKLSRDEIERELISIGLPSEAVQGIIDVLSLRSLSKLEGFLLTMVLHVLCHYQLNWNIIIIRYVPTLGICI
jgi:hypothetical protein